MAKDKTGMLILQSLRLWLLVHEAPTDFGCPTKNQVEMKIRCIPFLGEFRNRIKINIIFQDQKGPKSVDIPQSVP